MRYHVVWDWNGTIFNDAELVMSITNDNFQKAGLGPISREKFQAAYRRPVRSFYDDLAGITLSDELWDELNKWFHEEYARRAESVRLANGVEDALAFVAAQNWTQSLLSMYPEIGLLEFVKAHQLQPFFTRVDGTTNNTSWHPKAENLAAHVTALGVEPQTIIVVGDSHDDVDAARHVGARAILYDGGLHSSRVLHSTHDVVAHNMAEVINLLSATAGR
jgi:phosphoglycolate phosphatase-like HAD superfamily hydrolase